MTKHVEHVLDILVYIHGRKLAHNDVKTENLLVFQDGLHQFCKAGDWDSARTFQEPRNKEATPCAPPGGSVPSPCPRKLSPA